MSERTLPDFRRVEEAEKYNQLAAMGWVNDVWPTIMIPLNRLRYGYWTEMLGPFTGRSVFDIGCGYGLLSETMAREGASVVGLDASENLIEIARERASAQGLAITYHVGYAEALALDTRFDVVMAADVLEHVRSLEETVTRSSALVVEGGYYCFLTNNKTPKAKYEIITRPEEEHRILPQGYHNYEKFITPETLATLLERNGIIIKDLKGVELDIETKTFTLSTDLRAMYIGYGIKEGAS
jgi:2-polyprenyl-6-hydroxyphenyl methylase/3-demethylubiquinone-9 3-methyltransferase